VPLHQDNEALAARLRSIALLEDLVRRFPQDPDGPRWLAQSKKRLAAFYLTELHQPGQAAGILHETTQIDEQRLARDPGSATVKLDLALDRDYLGTAMWIEGDRLTGLQLVEQATAARAEILDADPQNYRVRYLLLADYVKLAKWLRQGNWAAEAHAIVAKGLAVASGVDAQQATT
jgi:hypothetical protein